MSIYILEFPKFSSPLIYSQNKFIENFLRKSQTLIKEIFKNDPNEPFMSENGDAVNLVDELKNDTPLNKIGKPIDIYRCVKWLIEDEFTTGQIIGVNGGYEI